MGKTLHVQRTATIAAPPERIYSLLDDFHEWERWSPWEELDANMAHTYSGPDHGVGAVHAWTGNKKAGEGRMEIVDADPPHRPETACREIGQLIAEASQPEGPPVLGEALGVVVVNRNA